MADEVSSVSSAEKISVEENTLEKEKLNALVSDLSQDYSKYLKVNVAAEVNMYSIYYKIREIMSLVFSMKLIFFSFLVDIISGTIFW